MQFDPSAPIWVQLVSEFSRRIVVGSWPSGSKVPGVRELAVELGVNPNTAQRALAELEREGLCRSERTSGRFVTDDTARIDALRAELAREAADEFIDRVRGLQMRHEQAQRLIEERWKTNDDRQFNQSQTG
ncbi:MAG TPA: GntR family transcriptional regulator [Beutenbergiaceae bacterium]|nr:GntR family transcriptional regulator [Beutenbergiaceae bacterium]